MLTPCHFDNCNEVGCFVRLTNSYCLIGQATSHSMYSLFESALGEQIPVVSCKISSTNLVGRLCVGNKNGLLVPSTISDSELMTIRNSLPDTVRIRKVDDRISALGNCIACNDHIALIHPEFERESEEIIADVLGVETFRTTIGKNPLVGSYCVFNNKVRKDSQN
jgi:translation initiation factor 6